MSQNQLQLYKYVELLNLVEGAQHRVNHDDCPSGTDTRQRLYIKKVTNGLVGHCFNCGESGWWFRSETRRLSAFPFRDPYDQDADHLGSANVLDLQKDIPVEYRVWLYKHFITDELIEKYDIQWDVRSHRLYVPYRSDGSYQLRTLNPGDNKWLTFPVRGIAGYESETIACSLPRAVDPHKLVFVEDVISYIRILEINAHYRPVALLGTNYNKILNHPHWIKFLSESDCLIWFDSDGPGLNASIYFERELKPIAKSVCVAHQLREPKELSPSVLEGVLKEYSE